MTAPHASFSASGRLAFYGRRCGFVTDLALPEPADLDGACPCGGGDACEGKHDPEESE